MNTKTVAATAAAVFAASTTAASAGVQCPGANACKGKGFIEMGNSVECSEIKSK